MFHSNLEKGEVDSVLGSLLQDAQRVTIASGYFGFSQVQKYRHRFLDIVGHGGEVTLIHGLGKFESIPKILENELSSLHGDITKLRSTPHSGVFFATERRYHGKIYRLESRRRVQALIGSSNFSKSGNIDNLEANVLTSDRAIIASADQLIGQIFNYSQEYSPGILPVREPLSPSLPNYLAVSVDILNRPVDFTLPVRKQEKSSFNLTFGRGRLVRPAHDARPYYIPRPYYEAEITLPKKIWVPPLTHFIPNDIGPIRYVAHTDNGMCFECNFNRKTSAQNDSRGLHETGGDFQSTPREALGRYVKDKLIHAGAMNYGDPITEDTLSYYGKNWIGVRVIDSQTIHLEF